MPRNKISGAPNAPKLFAYVSSQFGHFTAAQAEEAGYSRSLLAYYLDAKKITRIMRGIFVFNKIQPAPHAPLIPFWLWSEKEGIFSHDSALFLHEALKDPPHTQRMILPRDWKGRRLRIPEGLVVSYEDVPPWNHQQLGPLRVTTIERSNADCVRAGIALNAKPRATSKPQNPAEPAPYLTANQKISAEMNVILEEIGANYRLSLVDGRAIPIPEKE
jgi:hypothetical protein